MKQPENVKNKRKILERMECMMNYFDCHADTLTEIPQGETLLENCCNLDLQRVRAFADQYTQIFAIWKDRAEIAGEPLEEVFLRLYHRAVELLRQQRTYLVWCDSAADMRAAHAAGKGAAFLSVEDISIMGSLAGRIRELGIRFAMLTWNYENDYGCGAAAGQTKGLSGKGRALVEELLGQQVLLDISHLSDQGVEDLFLMTPRPVMASHSNVRDVCGSPRNLKKEHLRELIRRGGLMGLNFYGPFVGDKPRVEDLARHVDAVLELGGEDILALGSDFDGCGERFPQGIAGVQSVPGIQAALELAGAGTALVEKIFYKNAQRFLERNLI